MTALPNNTYLTYDAYGNQIVAESLATCLHIAAGKECLSACPTGMVNDSYVC